MRVRNSAWESRLATASCLVDQGDQVDRFELIQDQIHFLHEQDIVDQSGDLLHIAGHCFHGLDGPFGRDGPLLQHL